MARREAWILHVCFFLRVLYIHPIAFIHIHIQYIDSTVANRKWKTFTPESELLSSTNRESMEICHYIDIVAGGNPAPVYAVLYTLPVISQISEPSTVLRVFENKKDPALMFLLNAFFPSSFSEARLPSWITTSRVCLWKASGENVISELWWLDGPTTNFTEMQAVFKKLLASLEIHMQFYCRGFLPNKSMEKPFYFWKIFSNESLSM